MKQKIKSFLRIGFNAPIGSSLPENYKAELFSSLYFVRHVKLRNTLDNTALGLFAETGLVFSIVHTGFIGFVLLNLFRPADGDAKGRAQAVVSLAILMGFFCA